MSQTTSSRRMVLKTAAAATVAGAMPAAAAAPLHILVLGGTRFTGPFQVEYALARGHKVTLLNRSRQGDLFGGRTEQLVGDLGGDLSALKGRSFDVVIDNPTTLPLWVRNGATYLKGKTKHYIFISTISVYGQPAIAGANETAPTVPMPKDVDPYTTERGENYGALKAFAEREVEKHYRGIATIIRPGLIVGPRDYTDRFTYWPVRIDKGGQVLAPGAPTDPVQFIDVRDLAEWTVRLAEMRAFGVYNATGPDQPLTIGEMLYGIKAVTTAGAQFTWVPETFLQEQKIAPWSHMPVWIGGDAKMLRLSVARAVAKGLTFRPLAVTAADTLAWHKTRPSMEQEALAQGKLAGMSAAREAEVLAAYRARAAN